MCGFSPYGTFSDMSDSDPVALFTYVLGQLRVRGKLLMRM